MNRKQFTLLTGYRSRREHDKQQKQDELTNEKLMQKTPEWITPTQHDFLYSADRAIEKVDREFFTFWLMITLGAIFIGIACSYH